MILVNVLLIVALAASVVVLMTTAQSFAVDRSLRLREAAEASAIARGGTLSAVVALRRSAGDPRADAAALAQASQKTVRIAVGSFALTIVDAQARFNLATVRATDPASLALAARVAQAAGVSSGSIARLVSAIGVNGVEAADPAASDAGTIARLARVATILPVASQVDANMADPALIAALMPDPESAQALLALRARRGVLSIDDLAAAGIVLPPALRLGADLYWVRSRATVGDTVQQQVTLLLRRYREDRAEVVPLGRWWGTPSPLIGPPA